MIQRLTIFITLYFSFSGLFAQDAHYWTQQYGTSSILLSNSTIGGAEDLGAVFYNPARLGLIENPAFLISADVYELQRLKAKDAFGEKANVSKSDFGGVPSMTAGTFKVGFLKNHRFAYSILIRQRMNLDFDYKREDYGDLLDQFEGKENFSSYIRLNTKLQEEWYTLSWSYPIKENISIGVNTTGTRYTQRKGNQIDLFALSESNQTASYNFDRNYSLTHYGILWKAGLAIEKPHWRAGLTFTTPTLILSGKGNFSFEEFYSGIDGQSVREDVYTSNEQEDLPSKHRSPWAIGIGNTFILGKHKIHLSGEWYSRISKYSLMQSEPFTSQSTGEILSFELIDDLNAVLNAGIGAEFHLSDRTSLFLSGSTDFSAAKGNIALFSENQPIARNSTITSDFFHTGLGFIFKLPWVDLTLGGARTGAKQKFIRPIDFPSESDDGIFDQDEYSTLNWERWRLIFSISIPFLNDRLKQSGL